MCAESADFENLEGGEGQMLNQDKVYARVNQLDQTVLYVAGKNKAVLIVWEWQESEGK